MAYRGTFSKLLQNANFIKPLLAKEQPIMLRRQGKTNLRPAQTVLNTPSMFSVEMIKKYYEVVPIIAIVAVGFTCEVLYLIRLALTRDDVRFGKKMNCDYVEMRKHKKPPIRKVIPLLLITGAGVTGLIYWIVRSFLTRDDLRFSRDGKMLCEIVDANKPAPIRKALVFNQKYEMPAGLLEAIREPTEEEKQKLDETNSKKKTK